MWRTKQRGSIAAMSSELIDADNGVLFLFFFFFFQLKLKRTTRARNFERWRVKLDSAHLRRTEPVGNFAKRFSGLRTV